jgi:RNA ligase
MRLKYPRTPHLPYSKSVSLDDSKATSDHLLGKEVVVLEKMDGECTAMYSDYIHARSLDSSHHPSRSWVKQLHAQTKIPEDLIFYGENLYAKHTIAYENLPSYFLVFNILKSDLWLSWQDVVDISQQLNFQTVPVLYEGIWTQKVAKHWVNYCQSTSSMEGFVVRSKDSFDTESWEQNIAKYVSSNFVISTDRWDTGELVMNKLNRGNYE